jgi:hypothetical protein
VFENNAMAKRKDKIIFVEPKEEGLDSDTALKYMPPGHSPVDISRGQLGRLNCRSGLTENGATGNIENILSSKEIVDLAIFDGGGYNITVGGFSLPSGTNKVIGWGEDIKNNGILWMNYNSNGNYAIYRYLSNEDAVEVVFSDPLLGFDPDFLIHKAVLVGDTFAWTDNNLEPRSMNIKAAINRTNGSRVYSDSFQYPIVITSQDINFIKQPPINFLSVLYGIDFSYNYNNLRGKLFKFGYKWVYFDNSKSVMSIPSKTTLPIGQELINGDWVSDNYINNFIDIGYYTGPEVVSKIEFFVKEGENGVWRLYDTVEKYDGDWNVLISSNTTAGLRFYNDRYGEVAVQADVLRLYDNVPKKAGSIEVVEDNRAVFGDCTLDFDSVQLDVNMRYQNVSKSLTPFAPLAVVLSASIFLPPTAPAVPISVNDVIVIHIQSSPSAPTNPESWFSFYYTVQNVANYPSNALDSFVEQINNASTEWSVSNPAGVQLLFDSTLPNYQPISLSGFQYTENNKYPTFKKGQQISFALAYGDGKRWSTVNIQEDLTISKSTMNNFVPTTTIYSPFNTEFGALDDTNQRVVDFEINHPPPIGTTNYQWLVSPHQFEYQKFYISDFKEDKENYPGKILIDFARGVTDMISKLPKTVLSAYSFKKGDYIRFISQPINFATNVATTTNNYLNFEIEGVATSGTYAGYLVIQEFDYSYYAVGRYSLAEVYTPEKDVAAEDRTWYTFGEIGDILTDGNGNRYHAKIRSDAVSQDQTFNAGGVLLQGARGRFNGYDNYIHGRYTKFVEFAVESPGYSDFYSSEVTDSGKVNTFSPNVKETGFETMFIHGGRLLQDTLINDFHSFDLLGNSEILDVKHGQIRALRFRGYTLKVLQDKKSTSVYINRNILTLPDGSNDVTRTTKVFSQINPAKENWGTINPESIVQHENSIYFLDANAGKCIRDAGNGQYAISSYFMNKYFKGIAERVREKKLFTSGSAFCPAYFIENFDEYHLNVQITRVLSPSGIPPVTTITSETLYFSDAIILGNRVNRWKSFEFDRVENFVDIGESELLFDYFGWNSIVSLAWKDGVPYKLSGGSDYGNFIGTKYKQKIAIAANGRVPGNKKTYMSVDMDTNNNIHREAVTSANWSIPEDGVYIPPSTQYPEGMLSRVKAGKFVSKEGNLYTALGRDKNTPNSKNDSWNILNGRELKGDVAEITFENESSELVILSEINVNSVDSKSGE